MDREEGYSEQNQRNAEFSASDNSEIKMDKNEPTSSNEFFLKQAKEQLQALRKAGMPKPDTDGYRQYIADRRQLDSQIKQLEAAVAAEKQGAPTETAMPDVPADDKDPGVIGLSRQEIDEQKQQSVAEQSGKKTSRNFGTISTLNNELRRRDEEENQAIKDAEAAELTLTPEEQEAFENQPNGEVIDLQAAQQRTQERTERATQADMSLTLELINSILKEKGLDATSIGVTAESLADLNDTKLLGRLGAELTRAGVDKASKNIILSAAKAGREKLSKPKQEEAA